ncbi:BlaI/MecI/CopY family transcriptional regulator [Paucibacter sp. DJ1R-11]|uniref:BlaI/MecI/CopY family transcriptional regulator n=1 Tax=Paucibacter sp. DJ1R-11 TaxID=2893556 RepID=UPI0021E3ADC2|nr:BlaI/MecI/CopY family transcriptional regulator [Paucibacter sp. DJ1R-11]MCV2362762.1 BlaI/MecI/CopY family transcriptional regulator [Paucibacter sp. DJ1R-11]
MSPPDQAATMSISEAEAQVMEVLWQRHPQSTDEIAQALVERQDWQLATIKTLVNRLFNKGAISAEKDGRRYLYSPVLQRESWLSAQSMGLLDRLFQGRLTPLVAHFSAQRKLDAAELKALKQLIQDYEND